MNEIKKSTKSGLIISRVIIYAVLILLSLLTLVPLYITFINATRSNTEINQGISLIPSTYLADNWSVLMTKNAMPFRALLNTFIVSAFAPIISVYSSAMMAYSLVVYRYKLRNFFLILTLAIMMVPTQVNVVGYYKMMQSLKLVDSLWALILPSFATVGVVYFIRQYLSATLLTEIIESGRIDGANEFRIFNKIMLPLMYPALATQLIFSIVGTWNDYYLPSLLIGSAEKRTLTMMITTMTTEMYQMKQGSKFVGVAFSVLPMLVVYFCLQKYIINGIALGSVKG